MAGGRSGFSLLELLIAIAIIAVLAGLAVPGFQGLRARSAVTEAVQQVARDIERVRLDGRRQNRTASITIVDGAGSYNLTLADGTTRTVLLPQRTQFEVAASPISLTFAPPYGVIDPDTSGVYEFSVEWAGAGGANPRTVGVVGRMGKVVVR